MQLVTPIAKSPNVHTFPLNQSWESSINTAKDILEQANELQLEAGRILLRAKQEAKRKFLKQLSLVGLDKTQINKVIKAAEVADSIPDDVAYKLGLPLLLQLGQPKNEAARDAVEPKDAQASVVLKIKELRPAPTPRSKEAVSFVGNQKGGVGKLRIEIPGCPEAVDLYKDWQASGLSPLKWLQQRTHRESEQAITQTELNTYLETQSAAVASEIGVTPSKNVSFEPASLLSPEKGDVLHWKDKPSATVIKVVENGGVKLRYSNFKTQTVSMSELYGCFCPLPEDSRLMRKQLLPIPMNS